MVAVPLPHPTSEWSNCCRRRSISHVHWGVNLLTTRSFPFVELIVWCVTYLMRDLFEPWRLISNQLTIVIVHNSEALGDATKRKERHTGHGKLWVTANVCLFRKVLWMPRMRILCRLFMKMRDAKKIDKTSSTPSKCSRRVTSSKTTVYWERRSTGWRSIGRRRKLMRNRLRHGNPVSRKELPRVNLGYWAVKKCNAYQC